MAIVRPEMKSYIWLQTTDGSIQQVEEEVAMFCPMICREVSQTGKGSSKNYAIKLPQKELKTYDEKFIRLDTASLCELLAAADSLKMKPLVTLISRALARIIEGKTCKEIRETFHIPDDLTEEEKLEPLRNLGDDPRVRLLNRLYARKRKELKERQKAKNVEVAEECVDKRPVDDLLSFINGGDGDSKCVKTSKNKKKNRRRKDRRRKTTSNNENESQEKEEDGVKPESHNGEMQDVSSPRRALVLQDLSSTTSLSDFNFDFNEEDVDDGLDPALKKEIDREVEEFARILNTAWQDRVQEILSSGQERRVLPFSIHGNSSVAKYSG